MKKGLKYALIMCFCVFLAGCSDDKKDEPVINDSQQKDLLSKEEYETKVTNRLWRTTSKDWKDAKGNELPPMKKWIGFEGASAFYFLPEGYIYFASSSRSAHYHKIPYNISTGWFTQHPEKPLGSDIQLISLNDGDLYLKSDGGNWIDESNPELGFDESVWRYYTLVEDENPDMEALFQTYRPSGFDPADLGF